MRAVHIIWINIVVVLLQVQGDASVADLAQCRKHRVSGDHQLIPAHVLRVLYAVSGGWHSPLRIINCDAWGGCYSYVLGLVLYLEVEAVSTFWKLELLLQSPGCCGRRHMPRSWMQLERKARVHSPPWFPQQRLFTFSYHIFYSTYRVHNNPTLLLHSQIN